MSIPDDRRYLPSHEWHLVDDNGVCTIGITQFAADELTDITFVDLPEVGTAVTAGESFGEIESVKATSDLIAGVSGDIVEINEELAGDPSIVNSDPHEAGWMIRVKTNGDESDKLLDHREYLNQTGAG
ncbi:MAG: glycine cleavage system protein GcvH [Planctomycetota bacterium]